MVYGQLCTWPLSENETFNISAYPLFSEAGFTLRMKRRRQTCKICGEDFCARYFKTHMLVCSAAARDHAKSDSENDEYQNRNSPPHYSK
jgi:hypothetical protein